MPDLPLTLLLDKVSRAAATQLAAEVVHLGLRPKHVGLLAALDAANTHSQTDVGAWLGIGPSAVVALVDEAVALGLVTREPDPQDRRRISLTLTPSGRSAWRASERIARAIDDRLFAGADRAAIGSSLASAAATVGIAGYTTETGAPL